MKFTMLFSYVLFWLAHLAKTRLVDEELANKMCGKLGSFISSADDHCCNNPSGHYLVKPCNITQCPNETISKPCPFDPNDPANQTYIPDANNRTECIPANGANYCNSFNNTHRVDGSRTENSKCICDDGFSSATDDVTGGCHEHVPCKPGFQPFRSGNLTQSPQCEECPNGTFSSVHSVTELCHFLKNCTPNQEKNRGNSTHDTDCIEQGLPPRGGLPVGIIVLIVVAVAGGIFVIAWKKGLFKRTKRNENLGSADSKTSENGDSGNEVVSGIPPTTTPPSSLPPSPSSHPERYQTTQLNSTSVTYTTETSNTNGNLERRNHDIPHSANNTESDKEDSLKSNESISRKRKEANETPSPDEQENATTSVPPSSTPMERRDLLPHADSNHPHMQNGTSVTYTTETSNTNGNLERRNHDISHSASDTESSEKVSLLSREGEERSEGEPPPV